MERGKPTSRKNIQGLEANGQDRAASKVPVDVLLVWMEALRIARDQAHDVKGAAAG